MNTYTLLPALLLALLATNPARAEEQAPDLLTDAQARAFNGPLEYVVCLSGGRLKVRAENLRSVLFTAENFTPVKIFQGAGSRQGTYLKVQFPTRDQSVGWVARNLVRARSRCAAAPQAEPVEAPKEQPAEPLLEISGGRAVIRGLSDPNCCQWPVKGETTQDFTTKQRRFGAGRGGRLHAACDLYRYKNEPIMAVAPGQVLRNIYPFYQGTYALEVRHSGGFVVRYGEITGKVAAGVRGGEPVKMGQVVGYMGKVNSGCCEPMLHFELYSGARNGSLSGSGKFRRRADLMDPTPYLRRWQDTTLKSRR